MRATEEKRGISQPPIPTEEAALIWKLSSSPHPGPGARFYPFNLPFANLRGNTSTDPAVFACFRGWVTFTVLALRSLLSRLLGEPHLAREFREVLYAQPGLGGLVPEFREYLAQYPNTSLAGAREFFYVSTESFGLKPVASVTHVSVYVQPGHVVTASKQLYASHYFDGSLGLAAALDDRSDPSHRRMHLVYLNRSRIDLLSGFFGGLRRAILRGRLRDGMRKNLAEVVRRLEPSCAEYPNADATAP